jgi:hypothetical protein
MNESTEIGVAIGQRVPPGDIVIGDNLLAIHPDGTVDGRIENAGEAARAFVEFVRHLLGEDAELLGAIRYRVTGGYAGDRDAAAAVNDIREMLAADRSEQ